MAAPKGPPLAWGGSVLVSSSPSPEIHSDALHPRGEHFECGDPPSSGTTTRATSTEWARRPRRLNSATTSGLCSE